MAALLLFLDRRNVSSSIVRSIGEGAGPLQKMRQC